MSKIMGNDLDGELELEAFRTLVSSYEKARNEGTAPLNPALEELLSAMRAEKPLSEENLRIPGVNDDRNNANAEEITPEPFYFAKFWGKEGYKYFANMCGCPKIAAPGNWQNGVPSELEESLSQIEMDPEYDAQNLRFPLSCSDYTVLTDKNGKLCMVFDVVFNLAVMRQSMVNKQLRAFLINMAMMWISQKHDIKINSDFKIPKGKYKGDIVRKHFIRANKVKLVTEVASAESDPSFPLLLSNSTQESQILTSVESVNMENKGMENAIKCLQNTESHAMFGDGITVSTEDSNAAMTDILDSSMRPEGAESKPTESDINRMPMVQVTYIGRPVELVVLVLDFPSSVNSEELKVCVSNTELYLEINSYDPILVPLTFATSPMEVKAVFYSFESRLEIYAPFLSYTKLLEIFDDPCDVN